MGMEMIRMLLMQINRGMESVKGRRTPFQIKILR